MEAGNFYHVFNRGINRQPIFFEHENYRYFLKRFSDLVLPDVHLWCYCLMPNHFHLLLQVKEDAAKPGRAFQRFFISYAKSINKRYNRVGSLFQHAFKHEPVQKDQYLSRLIFYVHINPVKAGLANSFSEYTYSSYSNLIDEQPTKLSREAVLNWFGGRDQFIAFHRQELAWQQKDFKSFQNF